jgi:ABC-2 type transport system permease protein
MPTPPSPARVGRVNWRGVLTIWRIEAGHVLRAPVSWFCAPALTTLLYFAVMGLAAPADLGPVAGVPFLAFIMPALVVMTIAQNAFETTAWSIIERKVSGTIVDVLMPPLSPAELLAGFVGAALGRGLALGATVLAVMAAFVSLAGVDVLRATAFAVLTAALFALVGVLGGIWARKFDHLASVENFVIVPLAFLSGSFYDVERLAEPWATLSHANPVTFAVSGVRGALAGVAGASDGLGLAILGSATLVLGAIAWRLLARSPRLRP